MWVFLNKFQQDKSALSQLVSCNNSVITYDSMIQSQNVRTVLINELPTSQFQPLRLNECHCHWESNNKSVLTTHHESALKRKSKHLSPNETILTCQSNRISYNIIRVSTNQWQSISLNHSVPTRPHQQDLSRFEQLCPSTPSIWVNLNQSISKCQWHHSAPISQFH